MATAKLKAPAKSLEPPPASVEPFARALKHLREHPKNRPTRKTTLVRHLLTVLGNKITDANVLALINSLGQTGHLAIDNKGRVTYHL